MEKLKNRRVKIVCTIGPASSSEEMLTKLIDAGMDCARLNFSHNVDYENQRQIIDRIRKIAEAKQTHVGIFIDLGGPKLRCRRVMGGAIQLSAGGTVLITTEDVVGTPEMISTALESFVEDVQVGDPILLDDGLLELKVISKIGTNRVRAEIVRGGVLKDRKGMNLPQTKLSIPVLTEKDFQDVEFGNSVDIDYFAQSFVRTADDVRLLKAKTTLPIIAKIEKPEAIDNLESIAQIADAIMVARGDMGVELGQEKVPLAQKRIIRHCNTIGLPVITATQMLESMVMNSRPTRAEANDVVNAVLDGTSAVMLSAETAVGSFPVEAVSSMANFIREAESAAFEIHGGADTHEMNTGHMGEGVGLGAVVLARSLKAKAMIAVTHSGFAAMMLAKFRPQRPIIAMTDNPRILNQVSIVWGVQAHLIPQVQHVDDMFAEVDRALREDFKFKTGDIVVFTAGTPKGAKGSTDTIKVHRL